MFVRSVLVCGAVDGSRARQKLIARRQKGTYTGKR